MISPNRAPGSEVSPGDPRQNLSSTHGTLPPPEWTARGIERSSVRLNAKMLQRRAGPRAEEAWLRARVEEARAAGDDSATRDACVSLARWLASRDRDLDDAVELATSALKFGQNIELRRELAAWLESLGEPARAAAVLKPIASQSNIESTEAAYVLVRAGILKARAGAAAAAAAAFEAALAIDSVDPLPAELLATLWAWQPEVVPASAAIDAYLESARRRASLKQDDAELVDLWRAFAVAPSSDNAARALADALEGRGRPAAGDDVLRAHAQALAPADPIGSARVHRARRASAMVAREPFRALGAALDEGLGAALEGEGSDALDALLAELGMAEALAGRRQLRIRRRTRYGLLAEGDRRSEEVSADSAAMTWVRESVSGGPRDQAVALERLAASESAPVRVVLLAAAADRYLAAGNATAARNVAELATRTDPTNSRCVAALADVLLAQHRDRPAAAALERAIGMIGPRTAWCFALADTLDALGETELAGGWSQRCVALRPGDRQAITTLLDRLLRAGDGSRLRDALAWLLTQPQPVSWAAEPFAHALSQLSGLDADRAAVVARRALEVFGPKSSSLRDAMLAVAQHASDDAFEVAVLERWLSSGAEGSDRRQLLLRLASLRLRLGDDEGVARISSRAIHEGFGGPEFDQHIESGINRPTSSDAQLWRMRANAQRSSAADDPAAAVWAWRDFGAALWDLADDRIGAVNAWQRAARIEPSGYATLALDLVAFAGTPFAFDYLAHVVETEPDDAASAAIAADVAWTALSLGDARFAFDLVARGLTRSPSSADALEAAECAALRSSQQVALSALYDLIASRALGRFGRRAAHYRGARFFERSGEYALALKHAAQAFYAVPSEGATFHSLARAAERADDRPLAMRTLEQVAEREPLGPARAAWLLRAVTIAGEGDDATRRKVDLLLRAVAASPEVATLVQLRAVARGLLHASPEDRDGIEVRLGHAARMIGGRTGGPGGARLSVEFAATLLDLFEDSDGALTSVERAFACDADIEDYRQLIGHAAALARAQGAPTRVATMLATADVPHANVGAHALSLLAAIAAAAGDDALRARACVAAALRRPDDDMLVIAADEAVRAMPELTDGIGTRLGPERRASALLVAARAHVAAGAHGDAAQCFERAAELLDAAARAEVEPELRVALGAAGRGNEIELRAHREAAGGTGSARTRADGWTQVADLREGRGDLGGAVEALFEACRLDPDPLERWSALERVAETAGNDDARIVALEQIETRVANDGRPTVLKRLARAHEKRGGLESAERVWRRALALDAEDDEADQAIQSIIVARGDYDALVGHLAGRAARMKDNPDKREILRAVRLRRAAILEQRLGRTKDACDELGLLLREWPDSVGALRYLADLFDREGDFGRSAPLWRRAAVLEENPNDSNDLELRAARASHASGDLAATNEHANRVLARRPLNDEALALRIEAARALGNDADLGDALDAMATKEASGSPAAAELLLESARAAVRAGDLSQALARANRASEAAKDRAPARLLARALEYRIRGAGTPEEARQTIEELSALEPPLGPDDPAIRAFLLAEALDVVQGGGAGQRELEATRVVVGDHPLVALGLAERLAGTGQDALAVGAYRAALSGPLLDVRRPGAVALAGADAAMRAGSAPDAVHFLDIADGYEDARAGGTARRARLAAESVSVEPSGDVRLYDLEAAVHRAQNPGERARTRLALARGRLDFGDVRGAEPLLWEALADGLTEAGDVLAPLLASSPTRGPELVRLRWQQVVLEPGDVERLASLRAAALADDDRVHARAVEHVLRAFDSAAEPIPAPPLAAQPVQPGIMALLARPSMDAWGEALALLWEGAMQLFVRDAASYGITGVERVVPGPSSAIARLYEVAIRVLDVPRIPVFVERATAGAVESRVALLSPPSVILAGDVREETAALRFELGRGIAAALPHNVLRRALPGHEGQAVIAALQTAFGPPEFGRRVDARVARLSESFWQMIPARAQRRLQELLRTAAVVDYRELTERAMQSGRRMGMFIDGDFAYATHAVLAKAVRDATSAVATEAPTADNLRALCAEMPAIADLLCLAVRPEYADARWHSTGSRPPRRTPSSGRFSLF